MIENFGINVARLRKKFGYSQDELANIIRVNRQTISKIERGTGNPNLETIEKISEVFKATPTQLFGSEKEIALSDTPAILNKIDEYDEKLKAILHAEYFINQMREYNNSTLDRDSLNAINAVFELSDAIKTISNFYFESNDPYKGYEPIFEIADAIKTINNFYFESDDPYKGYEPIFEIADAIDLVNKFDSVDSNDLYKRYKSILEIADAIKTINNKENKK
ncbi:MULTISPECIES: helix-turn-helix transcriptional regulator [unclassified Enterococcus]|uniref:helix-turn-helix transcriptional regulator n=1 Tax=unclassified Enterococcus TaxID=2608891 RepID=UPI0019047A0B|nr:MULTISPECIES: helix-turn-helix domain-containing protein [unclassified Enterococcus]MBK0038005.1 helix-turn-helix domain-containing protein [Enterococcus sp. S52]MBK0070680.1 helix-turn-helix domain-containing protein [Enterococcus sp. S53]MBK0141331.1 helix-turn-helix domain-containing protein [Enterococcus sp. S76]MBK0144719.1 helix-turn-helix domain-containing protein [Enterococcus sp. S77]